jgi:hypothetical protein
MVRRQFRRFCMCLCVRAYAQHYRQSSVETTVTGIPLLDQLHKWSDVTAGGRRDMVVQPDAALSHFNNKARSYLEDQFFPVPELSMNFIRMSPPCRFPYFTRVVFFLVYSDEGSLCEFCCSRGGEDGNNTSLRKFGDFPPEFSSSHLRRQ